jgi:hypothetical protein
VLFLGGIYCAHDEKMQQWGQALLTAFTGVLGAVIGLIVGEKKAGTEAVEKMLKTMFPERLNSQRASNTPARSRASRKRLEQGEP